MSECTQANSSHLSTGSVIVFLLFFAVSGLRGQDARPGEDLIKLKNGQEIVGTITAEDEKSITVLFRGGEIVLPRRKIQDIIRGEKVQVEQEAERRRALDRFAAREEFFYIFYCGRCVGWRQTNVESFSNDLGSGYVFSARSVYRRDDGTVELDLKVSETVDAEGFPSAVLVSQNGIEAATLVEGRVNRGFLGLRENNPNGFSESEVLFSPETRFGMPLLRYLADATHFPEKGESFRVFDPVDNSFRKVSAVRTLRKEVVGGKHQFVTVWKLNSGERSREIWIDGYGGVVREELGHVNMVALRAPKDEVLAFSTGASRGPAGFDLELEYEDPLLKFRLARPNLTWSFEFADPDESRAITLVNPTLQASVDVLVLGRVERDVLPETLAMDVIERMKRRSSGLKVLYQKEDLVGGVEGLRFEVTADRKGVDVRTLGALTVRNGRAYALLLAAPTYRFEESWPHLDRILRSFELIREGTENPAATPQ